MVAVMSMPKAKETDCGGWQSATLLWYTYFCDLLWLLDDVGCVCMMISELLMFGVVFKGRILMSHSISANIDIGVLLWVPFLNELQASKFLVS